jgi:hypothetical protein
MGVSPTRSLTDCAMGRGRGSSAVLPLLLLPLLLLLQCTTSAPIASAATWPTSIKPDMWCAAATTLQGLPQRSSGECPPGRDSKFFLRLVRILYYG